MTRALVLCALLLAPAVARADDGGAWFWFEYRLPLWQRPPATPRLSLRFWSDTRLMGAASGLAQQFVRVGPLFEPVDWLYIAVHGTIYADHRPDGSFDQEARLEIEPTFSFRIWHFTFSDRNRLEYRWRESGVRVRYRNQLRVNYAPRGLRFIPFVWDEVLFDLRDGFNENRFQAGLGFVLSSHTRLDVGYMLRMRAPDWGRDHIAVVSLFIGVPAKKAN
jgi:hypothetical protein